MTPIPDGAARGVTWSETCRHPSRIPKITFRIYIVDSLAAKRFVLRGETEATQISIVRSLNGSLIDSYRTQRHALSKLTKANPLCKLVLRGSTPHTDSFFVRARRICSRRIAGKATKGRANRKDSLHCQNWNTRNS